MLLQIEKNCREAAYLNQQVEQAAFIPQLERIKPF